MNLSRILPYQNVTYRSPLSCEAAVQKLSEAVGPPQVALASYFTADPRPYNGTVKGTEFKILRTVKGRNSFRPVISGVIVPDSTGSVIAVKMRLHLSVIIVIIAWCSFVLYAGLMIAAKLTEKNGTTLWPLLWPAGMILFLCLLTVFSFHHECGKSKIDLRKLFEAEIV